ncbi:hypothetical protein CS388_07520 [Porphyromonas gingivalis]|nr:hypothetical protein CS545_02365 [Porphyromonas gingivalis]ATS09388.1 hypothetical protein CS388_07520 [Porphyromonas gingivalis]
MALRDCCRGVSLSSFAAELILSVFGKGQTFGIWTQQANRNFIKFPLEKLSFLRQINACICLDRYEGGIVQRSH